MRQVDLRKETNLQQVPERKEMIPYFIGFIIGVIVTVWMYQKPNL